MLGEGEGLWHYFPILLKHTFVYRSAAKDNEEQEGQQYLKLVVDNHPERYRELLLKLEDANVFPWMEKDIVVLHAGFVIDILVGII